jgi:threonine/homoserine/homoserine lactone efflux protein
MREVVLASSAYFLGFAAAVPVGATQVEIARRSLGGHPWSAMMVVAGSVLSDTLYGAVAFFGLAPFLRDPEIVAAFWGVNACILTGLGIWAIRGSPTSADPASTSARALKKRHLAFTTGFVLAVTNPLMIFWWLVGARLLTELGLVPAVAGIEACVFLLGGSLGIASYLSLFAVGVHRAKRLISEQHVRRVYGILGILLLGLAALSLARSLLGFASLG